jgi:hypothetical protein
MIIPLYHEYYKKLVGLFIDGDVRKINKSRENFDFKTVSESYRIINKATKGLLVYNYNDESKKIIDEIQRKQYLSRDDLGACRGILYSISEFHFKKQRLHCRDTAWRTDLVWRLR